jgi:hypothetical protein
MPLAVNVWCENIVIVTDAVDVNQTLLHHKTSISIKTTNNSYVKKMDNDITLKLKTKML